MRLRRRSEPSGLRLLEVAVATAFGLKIASEVLKAFQPSKDPGSVEYEKCPVCGVFNPPGWRCEHATVRKCLP